LCRIRRGMRSLAGCSAGELGTRLGDAAKTLASLTVVAFARTTSKLDSAAVRPAAARCRRFPGRRATAASSATSAHIFWNRGASACGSGRIADMRVAGAAVKLLLANEVLRTPVIERALDLALRQLAAPTDAGSRRMSRQRPLADVEFKLSNLAQRGGEERLR